MTQILIDRATLEQLVESLEEVSDYINRYAVPAHQLELDPIDEAITAGRAALAQQGEPVCAGCGIPAGDVHMSTCKSGKWPSRVSNGDTAAPAPQAQQGEPVAWLKEWVSVGYEGKETPLVRIDATPGCERWLERLNPRITPLIKAAPAPQAQPVAQPLTDKRIS